MAEAVVGGASLECDQGATPSVLIAVTQQYVTIDGDPVAVINDSKMSNVGMFGICRLLTETAEGVPTPCTFARTGDWTPGSVIQTIDNNVVLTSDSKLTCGIGGVISITSPKQDQVATQ